MVTYEELSQICERFRQLYLSWPETIREDNTGEVASMLSLTPYEVRLIYLALAACKANLKEVK